MAGAAADDDTDESGMVGEVAFGSWKRRAPGIDPTRVRRCAAERPPRSITPRSGRATGRAQIGILGRRWKSPPLTRAAPSRSCRGQFEEQDMEPDTGRTREAGS
ncbi:hypothetical protein PJI17_13540 [Mycobacterium kansasii]